MFQSALTWFINNWIELFGAVTGLIYLYFSIKQIIWLWPVGFITSATYIYVFFISKFYAETGLQVYYLLISIYGWYHWLFGKRVVESKELPVIRISCKLMVFVLLITVGLTVLIGYFLDNYTDSPLPYWDAFTTAGSIMATWMLARKILENWLAWIIIDGISIGLYFYRDLYPTVFLFTVYTIMAVVGYYEWKKTILKEVSGSR